MRKAARSEKELNGRNYQRRALQAPSIPSLLSRSPSFRRPPRGRVPRRYCRNEFISV